MDAPDSEFDLRLAERLTGDLRCVRCQYNLRGLSILDACPECAAPIRASILAAVDPDADVFVPISRPTRVAYGLMLGTLGAAGTCLAAWLDRGLDWVVRWNPSPTSRTLAAWFDWAGPVLLALTALGSLALVRPHAGIPTRTRLRTLAGSIAFGLAGATLAARNGAVARTGMPYFDPGSIGGAAAWLLLVHTALLGLGAVGLQPGLRALAPRFILFRTGAVDRQPLDAIVGSLGVVIVGGATHVAAGYLGGPSRDATWVVGTAFIAGGSVLLTFGLVGLVSDSIRLARVILHPPPSMRAVFAQASGPVTPPAPPARAEHGP